MTKCKGVIGFIFGHRYREVYDVDTQYHTAKEMAHIINSVTTHNAQAIFSSDRLHADRIIQPKEVTKVLVGRMCPRCGSFIKESSLTVDQ